MSLSQFAPISDVSVFSNDVLETLEAMSLTHDLDGIIVYGSAALRVGGGAASASDIDAMQRIGLRGGSTLSVIKSVARKMQRAVRRVMKLPLTYIPEIKAGWLPDCNVLGKATIRNLTVVDYDPEEVRYRLDEMSASGLLTTKEYREAYRQVEDFETEPSVENFIDLAASLRFDVVRWSAAEVAAGKKIVRGNRLMTLVDALRMPAMAKVDVVRWIDSANAFQEFSIVYFADRIRRDGRLEPAVDFPHSEQQMLHDLKYEALKNAIAGNVVKATKRVRAVARRLGDKDTYFRISRILAGSFGQLSSIRSFVKVLKWVMEERAVKPTARAKRELDAIKGKFSQIADLSPAVLSEFDTEFDAAVRSKSANKMRIIVSRIEKTLTPVVEEGMRMEMESAHLWPIPAKFLP